jgi:hypothetical protein
MITQLDKLSPVPLSDLSNVLSKAKKKVLGEVRLFDLIVADNTPLACCHGIYCFYAPDGTTCLYVGKVEGPQFIERLPSHLSLSEGSWFNQFMRGLKDETTSFAEAANVAKDCMLILIPIQSEFVKIAEKVLIERLNPKLNKRKSKSGYAGAVFDSISFGQVLQMFITASQPN